MKPTLKPLEEWICDECGEVIHGAEHGYLEWLKPTDNYEGIEHGFRIVHHALASPRQPDGNCYYDHRLEFRRGNLISNASLDGCVGPDGLVYLLYWVDTGRNMPGEELAELIRRLHTPYYEEARKLFPYAREDGFFDGANPYWPYLQNTLARVIEVYRAADEESK